MGTSVDAVGRLGIWYSNLILPHHCFLGIRKRRLVNAEPVSAETIDFLEEAHRTRVRRSKASSKKWLLRCRYRSQSAARRDRFCGSCDRLGPMSRSLLHWAELLPRCEPQCRKLIRQNASCPPPPLPGLARHRLRLLPRRALRPRVRKHPPGSAAIRETRRPHPPIECDRPGH